MQAEADTWGRGVVERARGASGDARSGDGGCAATALAATLSSSTWQGCHTYVHCVAGATAADVDMVILATSSPDDVFGSACQVDPLPPLCSPGVR